MRLRLFLASNSYWWRGANDLHEEVNIIMPMTFYPDGRTSGFETANQSGWEAPSSDPFVGVDCDWAQVRR